MMIRTHLAIAVLAILLFLPHISNKILFVIVALVATLIPDVDCAFSTLGSSRIFKFLQFFTKHRGIIHSFSFCLLVSVILALFFPALAFAFFLGYGLHLIADSFTQEGITPFWPYSKTSSGIIRTGGRIESSVFLAFVIIDLILLVISINGLF